ncbi:response regulator [Marinobacter daepoensis]|uniref:response regulator n=1 Tax=Marinobacter daepoensis TaxID=262077 RepID=UPI001C989E4B|nr:response regulator [Marinobacter daepoensis]MBY6034935.1 response regulator [Marinobacter daepoensis]
MPRGHALIIEDSSTARILLSRLLERADISTTGVATAEQAFPLLQQEHFDLIFLDHLLPGMDGFATLERLKQDPATRDIPVFMYTSQNAERYVQEARNLGAAGVIRKQVDRDQLMRTLDIILSNVPDQEQSDAIRVAVEEGGIQAANSPEQSSRGITGRLSTLEIAYEELEEEARELRSTLAEIQLKQSQQADRYRNRLRWVAGLTFTTFVVVIWGLSSQGSLLNEHIARADEQIGLLHSIVGGVIELIGRQ